MENITSRRSKIIAHMRLLGKDRQYRRQSREYLCDGRKLLKEALASGVEIIAVLWAGGPHMDLPESAAQYAVTEDLLEYVSPLKSPQSVLFSVKIPTYEKGIPDGRIIILDGVSDPGNVGAVLRTADAFAFASVMLVNSCADVYNPKSVRASMGAVFRQRVLETDVEEARALCTRLGLKIYGASSRKSTLDRDWKGLASAAVAIGSEGAGLSAEMENACDDFIQIPMNPASESLNASVAASILMWEQFRRDERR